MVQTLNAKKAKLGGSKQEILANLSFTIQVNIEIQQQGI